jgi:hypothetical protein
MPKLPPIPLTDKQLANQALTEAAKKQASETKKQRELDTSEEKWASKSVKLPSIAPHPPKSPKSNSLSRKRPYNDSSEELPIPTIAFLEDYYPKTGKLPSQAMSKDKHHSQKKSSDATDPFEVQGSVASLLKSVRSLKLGGKRTKKARKNHKKTRKATSRKNRRHSAKK